MDGKYARREISIHAPREGGDGTVRPMRSLSQHFNPRPPRGGRRSSRRGRRSIHVNFNPRPPRGGRPSHSLHHAHRKRISIHAPREGGDMILSRLFTMPLIFQSTPPARGATARQDARCRFVLFQSTPPARGATTVQSCGFLATRISIHAPREGGDGGTPALSDYIRISIHAPREGGDALRLDQLHIIDISIHAPREGGDGQAASHRPHLRHFNPRPPRGGRPYLLGNGVTFAEFQSTPPARGATSAGGISQRRPDISIHAPREGGDFSSVALMCCVLAFQSTPPARGATVFSHCQPSSQ